jgi:hypothetical protein
MELLTFAKIAKCSFRDTCQIIVRQIMDAARFPWSALQRELRVRRHFSAGDNPAFINLLRTGSSTIRYSDGVPQQGGDAAGYGAAHRSMNRIRH